ncbi:N-acetylglucosamine-6-phosphate deacetylase [Armatimonas sp.]|uniref:N-acetylglucosamine-6-phosphate deacetylase n=1 Tax=Armatimonas sp. TaxID=1872638 RepID=UPI00286D1025|nr:N-acetylglucosamine-6-phosphate deacetylase [Armatimonas sp.]
MELRNVRIVTPERVIENGSLSIDSGRIVAISEVPGTPSGLTVLPGFIDLHIHGGGGADTMDATPEALATICRTHATHGTTRLLATTITQSNAAITAALANVAKAPPAPDNGGASVAGIHLEGPYISPSKPGAQPKEFVRDYDQAEFALWLDAAQGKLRQITLASEQPGGEALMAACSTAGVVISLGHTDATAEQTKSAIGLGARQATHLFNAMNGIHHRNPGPIPVFMTDPRVRVEVIADGHHVAPEVIAMTYAAVGAERFIAITDAMAGAGNGDGLYKLGGHEVTVTNGRATLADGTLAGSVLLMDQAARNLRAWCNLGWQEIAQVTATNAADQQGWHDTGRLIEGSIADLVIVNDELTVQATYVGGDCVYSAA